jgi:hypothetical protein
MEAAALHKRQEGGIGGGGGGSLANDDGRRVVAEPQTVMGSGGFTRTALSLGPTGDVR